MRLLIFLLASFALAEDLITLERAKELRKEVKWKVANPHTNPLRKYTLEEFRDSMKGSRPITREVAKTLQGFLENMDRRDIKALIEENTPMPKWNQSSSRKVFAPNPQLEKKNAARNLQVEEEHWWEEGEETQKDVQTQKNTSFIPPANETNVDKPARGDDYYYGTRLPTNFDGRSTWGGCIHSGGDQGTCDGCWAFGITNHLSDRFCIWGKDVTLSAQDLLECTSGNSCCNGGTATRGYNHIINYGIVSEDCKGFSGYCEECRPTSCTRYRCQPGSIFWADSTEDAKFEIYNYGPIEAVFDVYDDFAHYAGGVYYRTSSKYIGVHTVEVLGWGVEDGMSYWLCKNSWGDDWGDYSFFKVRMGDCGINEAMTSCRPSV
eukprot:TRINITY_DN7257_c0_g1_i15.p1 TRINITY_DN7257_c0_g1~~TRINITY_DN7257_c0_g1_i15.p1  ORF type:complete len:378 (+),score=101.70 TRINITY_DN7257_c0_g1_i15:254-1387(+)